MKIAKSVWLLIASLIGASVIYPYCCFSNETQSAYLSEILADIQAKFNVKFTIESCDANDGKCRAFLSQSFYINKEVAPDLTSIFQFLETNAQIPLTIISEKTSPFIFHVIETELLINEKYILNKKLNFYEYQGSPNGMVFDLQQKGFQLQLMAGGIGPDYRGVDGMTSTNIRGENLSIRDILWKALPIATYNTPIYTACTEMDSMITTIVFGGPTKETLLISDFYTKENGPNQLCIGLNEEATFLDLLERVGADQAVLKCLRTTDADCYIPVIVKHQDVTESVIRKIIKDYSQYDTVLLNKACWTFDRMNLEDKNGDMFKLVSHPDDSIRSVAALIFARTCKVDQIPDLMELIIPCEKHFVYNIFGAIQKRSDFDPVLLEKWRDEQLEIDKKRDKKVMNDRFLRAVNDTIQSLKVNTAIQTPDPTPTESQK